MTKKKPPSSMRDRRVLIPMSPAEFQLIDYAASRSNIRGTFAWMRAKLLEAAKARLSDEVVADILEGRATLTLMRESLAEARRDRPSPAKPSLKLVRSEPESTETRTPGRRKARNTGSRR